MTKSEPISERACAVVVTYKRQELLRRCIHALQAQTRPAEAILVVDNCSKDGTIEMVHGEFSGVEVLALPENSGGAGGFHAGMKWAVEHGFDWAWVMDDDGCPDAQCLHFLMEKAAKIGTCVLGAMCLRTEEPETLSFPVPLADEFGEQTSRAEVLKSAADDRGVVRGWAAFMNGVLFPAAIIKKVGLPRREMFIWGDEVEYAKRIKAAGFDIYTVPDAIHFHPADKIAWRQVLRAGWNVYEGKLDWRAFCFFRNSGLLARLYGRGGGVSMLVRYFYFYLVCRRLDLRALRFFLRAYVAGWRGDFSRKVPF